MAQTTPTSKREPTYRIDPIAPTEIGARFGALLARLEPPLDPAGLAEPRERVAHGGDAGRCGRADTLPDPAPAPCATGHPDGRARPRPGCAPTPRPGTHTRPGGLPRVGERLSARQLVVEGIG